MIFIHPNTDVYDASAAVQSSSTVHLVRWSKPLTSFISYRLYLLKKEVEKRPGFTGILFQFHCNIATISLAIRLEPNPARGN